MPTKRDEVRAVATDFLELMGSGAVDRALALVAPHADAELGPLKLRGPASDVMRRYMTDVARAFPDLRLSSRRLFVGNDRTAVAEVTLRGAQSAELWGIAARGRVLDLDQAWLLGVDDSSKIDRIGAYWCQYQLCRMLGARRLDRVGVEGRSR